MLLFTSTKRTIPAVLFMLSGVYALICGPFQGAGITIIPTALFTLAIGICFILPELLYYRKPAAEVWKQWDNVHNSNKQQERFQRAVNGDVTLKKICPKSKCAIFIGANQGNYRTTLASCSCPDFKKRKVPCKHMYYLAHELNLN